MTMSKEIEEIYEKQGLNVLKKFFCSKMYILKSDQKDLKQYVMKTQGFWDP